MSRHVPATTGWLGALCAVSLVVAGCGSNVDEGRLDRAASDAGTPASTAAPAPAGASDATADATAAEGPVAEQATAPVAATEGGSGGGTKTTAPAKGPAAAARSAASGSAGAPAAGGGAGSGGGAASSGGSAQDPVPTGSDPAAPATPGGAAPAGAKSKLVIGSFGTSSGPIGAVFAPVQTATRAWVADVNARGGLDGHPVTVLYADDGGDGARALAIARRMVEQDKVLFFLNLYQVTTSDAVIPYLEQKKVPVIMSGGGLPDEDHSEFVFNPMVGGDLGWVSIMVESLRAQSEKRKVAVLYCRETKACPNGLRRMKENQDKQGVQVVYEAEVSIAQPDYTAEVLQARNSGAEVLANIADAASGVRIIRSALRQDWRPVFLATQAANDDVTAKAPDLKGLITVTQGTSPYMDGPYMADYRDAVAKYVPGGPLGGTGAAAWAGVKLVEKIAPAWGAIPTTQNVIDSLYALKGETLGGLIPPLTFPKGNDRTRVNLCGVPLKFDGEKIRAPLGNKFHCAKV
jgi:branched-chain amino acid transport system substrate-binding protein